MFKRYRECSLRYRIILTNKFTVLCSPEKMSFELGGCTPASVYVCKCMGVDIVTVVCVFVVFWYAIKKCISGDKEITGLPIPLMSASVTR